MKTKKRPIWAVVLVALCALSVSAHHSFTAEFDASQRLTIKGTVSKVDWVNPHVFVYVDVTDASGKVTTWQLQSLPTRFFHGSGLTKETLLDNKQEATVTLFPAKDGTKAYGWLIKISYPDGHFYNIGDPNPASGGR
jgi:hypothetical protein